MHSSFQERRHNHVGLDRDAAELALRAYRCMAGSFVPCPAHLLPSFRLWHYPVAGPQVSWSVFHGRIEDDLSDTPMVRRVAWDRDGDLERLELGIRLRPGLHPTLAMTELKLDAAVLALRMEEVTRLGIPRASMTRPYLAHQRAEFGLDGFDLEGRDGRPIVRVEWSRNPPPMLEGISGWAARVRQWFGALNP